jgi:hypothetical protein
MAKYVHDEALTVLKSNNGPGTRGDSAGARNKSGNHTGNRTGATRSRGYKTTRYPKSY